VPVSSCDAMESRPSNSTRCRWIVGLPKFADSGARVRASWGPICADKTPWPLQGPGVFGLLDGGLGRARTRRGVPSAPLRCDPQRRQHPVSTVVAPRNTRGWVTSRAIARARVSQILALNVRQHLEIRRDQATRFKQRYRSRARATIEPGQHSVLRVGHGRAGAHHGVLLRTSSCTAIACAGASWRTTIAAEHYGAERQAAVGRARRSGPVRRRHPLIPARTTTALAVRLLPRPTPRNAFIRQRRTTDGRFQQA